MAGDGPLHVVMTEVWGTGALRGYPQVKIIEDDPNEPSVPTDEQLRVAMGARGSLTVIHSSPNRVIFSGTVSVGPADARTALATYFNQSLRTPTAVALHRGPGRRVTGLLAEKMPGGDTETFVAVLERFADGSARAALATTTELTSPGPALALPDLRPLDQRPLRLACRCSEQKILEAVAAVPQEELREMNATGEAQEVVCHLCAHRYEIRTDQLALLLNEPGVVQQATREGRRGSRKRASARTLR